jgi:hypothetical protein
MSDAGDKHMTEEQAPAGDGTRLLAIGALAISGLTFVIALVLLLLVMDMRGDIADHSRKIQKAAKGMREDSEEIHAAIEKLRKSAARAEKPAETQGARPMHMDSVDSARDCVVRPGSKGGLPDCLSGR